MAPPHRQALIDSKRAANNNKRVVGTKNRSATAARAVRFEWFVPAAGCRRRRPAGRASASSISASFFHHRSTMHHRLEMATAIKQNLFSALPSNFRTKSIGYIIQGR